jgi:hypothetical protein
MVASYEKIFEARNKPSVEVSSIFLMIASAYFSLFAFFGVWGLTTLVLQALAFIAALFAWVESRKYLLLVQKAYQKSDPSYQVEAYKNNTPTGLLPLVYYSDVSYDGVLYRVDGTLDDPFRSQQSKLPLALIPVEERRFLPSLQAHWVVATLLLFVSVVGFVLSILGGHFTP